MIRRALLKASGVAAVVATVLAWTGPASALDSRFKDENGDLVADTPSDPSQQVDPGTLIFAYTPVEDPAVYAKVWDGFLQHMEKVTGKKVQFFPVQSNAAQIEAMRAGRLHVTGLASGQVGFAVNLAGAVPFSIKGNESGPRTYTQVVIVKKDSPFQKLADLKGKRVAHTSPSSNSGNLAPRALFPAEGLVPEKDYKVLYSGKHDQSLMGVVNGDYDAAPITSDIHDRFINRGIIKKDDLRIIYKSGHFPTSAFAHAHDLEPGLAEQLKKCFFEYRFSAEMKKEFLGDDRFLPISYKTDWALVRKVAEDSGTPYNRAGFDRERAAEEAARAKAAEAKAKK